MRKLTFFVGLATLLTAASGSASWYMFAEDTENIPLRRDLEQKDEKGNIFNPSTQSVNRYSSVLSSMTVVKGIKLAENETKLSLSIGSEGSAGAVHFNEIDYYQLVPILPYPISAKGPDDFDKANLMFGEFARNGLAFSYQEKNTKLGYFNDLPNKLFATGDQEDYGISNGNVAPSKLVRPKRFSIINNCLKAGLWELSAIDAVGEMYHAWFNMPTSVYFGMIRKANNLNLPDREIGASVKYKGDLTYVTADLGRLRNEGPMIFKGQAGVVASKDIGGYSTQESRQKSQQKYFEVSRGFSTFGGVNKVDVKTFAGLEIGDVFSLRKFVNPGLYSASERKYVPFDPFWRDVEIKQVTPLTQYRGGKSASETKDEYVELSVYSTDRERRIVVGNIPLSLLVEQEDYHVAALGAGVMSPWEFAERRYLRLTQGPVPHFAYQLIMKDKDWRLENNHEGGLEQIALRVVRKNDRTFLRITFIAYEREMDLLELETEVTGALADKLIKNTAAYEPPLFRFYEDANIL